MIAEILAKYVRKVREFAKENSSYDLAKNMKFQGSANELILYCCDGESGIRQRVKIHGTPIIGEFCVNAFNFSKILHNLHPQADIIIKINKDNYYLDITGPAFKFKLPAYSPDKIIELSPHKNWIPIKQSFFDKLKSVIPLCLHEEYPIVYNGNYISYVSPHAIIFIPQKIENLLPFKTNTKISNKIFVDYFENIDVTENQIFLSNENCEIFIPQISQNSPQIENIVKAVKEFHTITTDVNTTELSSAYNVIESLAEINELGVRGVDLIFEKNTLMLKYLDSEFLIADVKYAHPNTTHIKVPFDHLKVITAPSFVKEAHYVKILLAEQNKMFVTQKGPDLTLVGGLSK